MIFFKQQKIMQVLYPPLCGLPVHNYCQISHISHTQYQNLNVSHLVLWLQSFEASCSVEKEDVVGAAPTGDAPTTSEW